LHEPERVANLERAGEIAPQRSRCRILHAAVDDDRGPCALAARDSAADAMVE